jgi:hypothetical protein
VRAATPLVSSVRFTRANDDDVQTGLLGFVTCTFNDVLQVDGVTLRRCRDGRIALSWPARSDGAGRRHPILRPLDDHARQQLERQIIKAIAADLTEFLP